MVNFVIASITIKVKKAPKYFENTEKMILIWPTASVTEKYYSTTPTQYFYSVTKLTEITSNFTQFGKPALKKHYSTQNILQENEM